MNDKDYSPDALPNHVRVMKWRGVLGEEGDKAVFDKALKGGSLLFSFNIMIDEKSEVVFQQNLIMKKNVAYYLNVFRLRHHLTVCWDGSRRITVMNSSKTAVVRGIDVFQL